MTDYLHKTRLICCRTYIVNQEGESLENLCVHGLIIVAVPFGG